ncbi:acyl carrier protein [Allokutzneria albata]|uniref:Phosphopantetheine attachment site n=1 Tax=Allokutzneria albata TaxID=211114 RepID=A0A1G9RPY1_ALLAB|nr:phosphopantetheine-binding protein [Allokutzneria albata]SDM25243.1 Phosphopantetheine attachment site [Allokutzneria albata]
MSDNARAELRQFIVGKFPKIELADDQDIFALGFVNSLFAMELVMFIEKTFSVRIPNDELKLDNFRSIDAMTDLIARQQSVTA